MVVNAFVCLGLEMRGRGEFCRFWVWQYGCSRSVSSYNFDV